MMKPITEKMLSVRAEEHQREEHADQRQRQRGHDRERLQEAAELRGEHEVDEDHRDAERDQRVLARLGHHLAVAALVEAVAGRQLRWRRGSCAPRASTSPEVAPLPTPPQIWIWRCRLRRSIWRSESEGLNSAIWRSGTMRGVRVGIERVARARRSCRGRRCRCARRAAGGSGSGGSRRPGPPTGRPARRRSCARVVATICCIDTPMSLASSRFTTMSSAGLVGLKLLSTSTVPFTALIFAITSCEMRSSSRDVRALHEDADRPVPADVHLQARDALQALAERVVHLLLGSSRAACLGHAAVISNHAEFATRSSDRRLISGNSRSAASTCSAFEVV